MRVLLFTDTLGDVNGVSRFILNASDQAAATGRDLRVYTSTNFECPARPHIVNFKPLLAMKMPGYANLELALPPLVKMLRSVNRHRPDVIHISTPGPVGAVGFLAGRMLKVPILGVYHTDFPAYIDQLFKNESMTYFSGKFMRAFYAPFSSVFTRSADYVDTLTRLGMSRERILPLLPGIVTEQFHPRSRDLSIWPAYGARDTAVRVLSVGRVSVEKNLPLLTRVWKAADARLKALGVRAELVVVGDGPYRAEMEEALTGTRTRFLGFRYAEELSRIYASSDLFVFPSVTDTLGQVVMESQAAGLPVIVTDEGGPKEVVEHTRTGFVIPAADIGAWTDRIVQLTADEKLRARMGASAHESMQGYSMQRSFEHFWGVHEDAWVECLNSRGITAKSSAQRRSPNRKPASPRDAAVATAR